MDKIRTLTDVHLFAETLVYKLPNNEMPSNTKICLKLFPYDFEELRKELNSLPAIIAGDRVDVNDESMEYRYEGIKFIIFKNLTYIN